MTKCPYPFKKHALGNDIAIGAGGLEFVARAGQIGRSVATAAMFLLTSKLC